MVGLGARKCAYCDKPLNCFAYTYYMHGKSKHDYFHVGCFKKFLKDYADGDG